MAQRLWEAAAEHNGPEFVAEAVKGWISGVGAKTAYIEKGSPWENGYVESFNSLPPDLIRGASSVTSYSTPRCSIRSPKPRS